MNLEIPAFLKREKVAVEPEKRSVSPEVEAKRRAHKIGKWCGDALERERKRQRKARRQAK